MFVLVCLCECCEYKGYGYLGGKDLGNVKGMERGCAVWENQSDNMVLRGGITQSCVVCFFKEDGQEMHT